MQANTQRRAAGLKDKIPDIQKTLETVRFLSTRGTDAEPIETTFELNDTLFAKAEVPPTDEVYLWLGANVMLAYPIPEAVELLTSKLSTAKASLATCEEDLDFLREQITVGPSLGNFSSWLTTRRRHWRLHSHECTTGTWHRGGKSARQVKRRRRGSRRTERIGQRHQKKTTHSSIYGRPKNDTRMEQHSTSRKLFVMM